MHFFRKYCPFFGLWVVITKTKSFLTFHCLGDNIHDYVGYTFFG